MFNKRRFYAKLGTASSSSLTDSVRACEERSTLHIAVGRSTRDHAIDVDLSLEGPAAKVSRKQATIRLRNSGDFFMSSEGKRPIFVDGRPVLQGNKVKINHNSIIEIAGLRFIFLVNQDLISAIRQEAVKVNIPV